MEKPFSKIVPQPWFQIALLLGFCVLIYFINLGQWDLWNPDEPRYGQVAKEMVTGGDWILMHYNGEVYSDKPPLFFWLIGLSSYLWHGFTSFAIRFPAAFFGTLTVLLTFLLGRVLFHSLIGFFSGLILVTSIQFAYLSVRANIDTTLTFFITASLLCIFLWYRNRPPHPQGESKNVGGSPLSVGEREAVREGFFRHGNSKNLFIYGFYVAMAFATLAKGPVGFILPLLVTLVYLALQKDWKGIKEMRLLPGMLLFLGIVLCWYLPAVWKGGRDYLNETLLVHSINRYSQGWAKTRPIYYYLSDFPVNFLPWILFLPSAFVYAYSRENLEGRREFLFLTVWFAVIFIFFSLSKGKRTLYLLPLFPAASLLVGKLLHDFVSSQNGHFRKEWVFVPIYVLMGMMLVAGTVLPWIVSVNFPSYLNGSLPLAFLLVGGSLVLFVLYRVKNHRALFLLFIGIVAAGYFYSTRAIFPLVNRSKSARFISQEITSRIQPGEKLAVYGRVSTAPFNFYTGIVPILDLADPVSLLQFLNASERVFCLMTLDAWRQLQKMEGGRSLHLIARHPVGGKDVVLISNRLDQGRNL
jgi:4-amino-4-deoxy-L-arabinose transferase-like glycosyltransferase